MKLGSKHGLEGIKTLDDLLHFPKNGEDFNQGRQPDTAASVHDAFLFYNALFLVKFCIQSPKHVTVIYYKTMFNNVFNKEKGFWADLGEVQRLSNVFSNEIMAVD